MTAQDNIRKWSELAGHVRCTFPLEEVIRRSHIELGGSVLDYGCGDGRLLSIFSEAGILDVYGCDASEKMCRLAKIQNPKATVLCVDFAKQVIEIERRFDLITAVGVLSSVVSWRERVKVMMALRSYLSQRGRIVIADFGVSTDPLYAKRYKDSNLEAHSFFTKEGLCIHHFTKREIVELFKMAGFQILQADTVSVITMHGNRVPGHFVLGTRKS